MTDDGADQQSIARPITVSPSRTEIMLDIVSLGAIFLTITMIAQNWNEFPPEIATHFDAMGRPDTWGSKMNLLVIPGLQVLMVYVPMTWIRRFPIAFIHMWQTSEGNVQGQYLLGRMQAGWVKVEIILFLMIVNWYMVALASNHFIKIFPAALIVFIIILVGTTVYYTYLSKKLG